MERKKRERYSTEFKQQAVERMNVCDNITRLSRELGVARHLLYYWRDRWLHAHPQPGLYREVCLRKQISNSSECWPTKQSRWIFSDVPCKE